MTCNDNIDDDLEQRMIDAVAEGDLSPQEKETSLSFSKDQDRVRVTTREAGIMRRLLALDYTEVRWVIQETSDGSVKIDAEDLPEEFDGRRKLTSIHGFVPVGALKLSGSPRKSTSHAQVVSSR